MGQQQNNNEEKAWLRHGLLGGVLWCIRGLSYIIFGSSRIRYIFSYAGMAKVILWSLGFFAVSVMVWVNYPTLLDFVTGLSKDWITTEYGVYQAVLVDVFTWFIMFILIAGVVVFDRLAWVKVEGNFGAKIVFVVCCIIFNLSNETLSWFSYSGKSKEEYKAEIQSDTSQFSKYKIKDIADNAVAKTLDESISTLKADKKSKEAEIKESKLDLETWEKRVGSTNWDVDYVNLQILHYQGQVSGKEVELQNIKDKIQAYQGDKVKLAKGLELDNEETVAGYLAEVDFWGFVGGLKGVGLGILLFVVSTALHKIEGTKYTIAFQLTEKKINGDGLVYNNSSKKKRVGKKKSTNQKSLPAKPTEKGRTEKIAEQLTDFGFGMTDRISRFGKAVSNRITDRFKETDRPTETKTSNSLKKESKKGAESGLNGDSSVGRSEKMTENQPNPDTTPTEVPTEKKSSSPDSDRKSTQVKNEVNQKKMEIRQKLIEKWSEHRFSRYIPDLLDIIEGEVNDTIFKFSGRIARKDGIRENFSDDSLHNFAKRLRTEYEGLTKKHLS